MILDVPNRYPDGAPGKSCAIFRQGIDQRKRDPPSCPHSVAVASCWRGVASRMGPVHGSQTSADVKIRCEDLMRGSAHQG